nr:unnamed protein product [Digitaria exilis]
MPETHGEEQGERGCTSTPARCDRGLETLNSLAALRSESFSELESRLGIVSRVGAAGKSTSAAAAAGVGRGTRVALNGTGSGGVWGKVTWACQTVGRAS